MKKIIITTAIVLAASFSFYLHESGSLSTSIASMSQNLIYENLLVLGVAGTPKLDISQADVK